LTITIQRRLFDIYVMATGQVDVGAKDNMPAWAARAADANPREAGTRA
jgi:hypothetical protein